MHASIIGKSKTRSALQRALVRRAVRSRSEVCRVTGESPKFVRCVETRFLARLVELIGDTADDILKDFGFE